MGVIPLSASSPAVALPPGVTPLPVGDALIASQAESLLNLTHALASEREKNARQTQTIARQAIELSRLRAQLAQAGYDLDRITAGRAAEQAAKVDPC